MLIVADVAMPQLQAFFTGVGELRTMPGRDIDAALVRDADVLLVRSVTRVDEALISGSRLQFIGSATAGTDHVDQAALQRAGIHFAHAPGCNANAVADYVMTASIALFDYELARLSGIKVGVVGCGACGSRVRDRFRALGAQVLVCDPPRARLADDAEPYVDMQAIYDCDLISMHVPLQRVGPDATIDLLDVDRLKPGAILINAARGEVLDGARLRSRLERVADLQVVMDVWPGEPTPDSVLASLVRFATPHIAGYSLDGKWRGTAMLFDALCEYLGTPAEHPHAAAITAASPLIAAELASKNSGELLGAILQQAYDIAADDRNLRAVLAGSKAQHGAGFDALRKTYRERRDFSAMQVMLPEGMRQLAEPLTAIGFRVEMLP